MGKEILIPDQIASSWARDAETDTPLSEYPRPQFVRSNWICLNGLWDYTVTAKVKNIRLNIKERFEFLMLWKRLYPE